MRSFVVLPYIVLSFAACKKGGSAGSDACTVAAGNIADLAMGSKKGAAQESDVEKVLPAMKATLATHCRDDKWADAFVSCTSTASDGKALDACMKGPAKLTQDQSDKLLKAMAGVVDSASPGATKQYLDKSKATEAKLGLNKISKAAKLYFIEIAKFPMGNAATLPATACCSQPDHKCAPSKDWATDPVWKQLDFTIDEPTRFQYAYQSDGLTFTATAVGDLDCDGHAKTYTMKGSSSNGSPSAELVEPQ